MNCKEIEQVIHGYLDGEVDLVRSLAIEQHLKDCPACARAQQQRQSLRTAMAADALYFKAPKGLEKRVRSAVRKVSRAEARAEGRPWGWNWSWPNLLAPLAATALVLLIALPLASRHSSGNPLLEEILSAHVRSLMADTSHLTDVTSSDQHTVKPWFTGKLPFSPSVTDLAALVYQRRKHLINLFSWPITQPASSSLDVRTRQGYNVIHWNQGGMGYWAVSDVNVADLREFVRLSQGDSPSR